MVVNVLNKLALDGSMKNESIPANIYLFQKQWKHQKKMCEICSKLTLKTSERHSNSCCIRTDKSFM